MHKVASRHSRKVASETSHNKSLDVVQWTGSGSEYSLEKLKETKQHMNISLSSSRQARK